MRKLYSLLSITFIVLFVVTSCSEKEELPSPPKPKEETINPVSQFVYDGLSAFYLWSNEMINKEPTAKDSDPEKYFESVLFKTDTDNGWSWITDDAKGLIAEFDGEPMSFGYSLKFIQTRNNKIYALVKYVHANTPASNAGLKRLDLIGKVNGKPITTEKGTNYISQRDIELLYGNNAATFTIYKLTDDGISSDYQEILIAPQDIKTDPVLFEKVYNIGNKKIGYLFYTNFTGNYNDRLFEVFNKFEKKNVTDLILDLRYNPGGGLDAASYLVSLFAPKTLVEEKTVLTTLTFNQFLNEYYASKRWSRDTKLGDYQKENVYNEDGKLKYKAAPNPINANIDINKVYIIATENSASASELTIFCSRPIMGESNVIHIGGETSGKYTASFTVHAYDNDIGNTTYDEKNLSAEEKSILKNWAMQPIVAVYKDKNGIDFIEPGYLKPNVQLEEGFGDINYWTQIGDTTDVFLGQALYMITGDASYKPIKPKSTLARSSQEEIIEMPTRMDDAKPVLIDNITLTSDDFKEITRMRNLDK